jgi:hypothetical protein
MQRLAISGCSLGVPHAFLTGRQTPELFIACWLPDGSDQENQMVDFLIAFLADLIALAVFCLVIRWQLPAFLTWIEKEDGSPRLVRNRFSGKESCHRLVIACQIVVFSRQWESFVNRPLEFHVVNAVRRPAAY